MKRYKNQVIALIALCLVWTTVFFIWQVHIGKFDKPDTLVWPGSDTTISYISMVDTTTHK